MDALNEKGMVSVIVPCYNQAIYLPEALNSLLAQTYQCWEAIVVNDGSPDETEKVALEYTWKDSRIKYVFKENGGLSSARNKGIELAQGEFILPLDADDIIHPEYMEKAMEAFEDNPFLKLVFCRGVFFGVKKRFGICVMKGMRSCFKEIIFFVLLFLGAVIAWPLAAMMRICGKDTRIGSSLSGC